MFHVSLPHKGSFVIGKKSSFLRQDTKNGEKILEKYKSGITWMVQLKFGCAPEAETYLFIIYNNFCLT